MRLPDVFSDRCFFDRAAVGPICFSAGPIPRSHKGPFSRAGLYLGERLWGPYVRRTARTLVALDPIARARALIGGFPEENVVVLPPGIDPRVYRPGLSSASIQRHGISGRILLYVGRVERGRGLDVLIQAFPKTVGQRYDWSLVIAGEGSARAETRASIDRMGIGSRVQWLRPGPRGKVPRRFLCNTLAAVPAFVPGRARQENNFRDRFGAPG